MLRKLKIALPMLAFATAVLPMKQTKAAPIDCHRSPIIAPDDGGAPRLLPHLRKDARA